MKVIRVLSGCNLAFGLLLILAAIGGHDNGQSSFWLMLQIVCVGLLAMLIGTYGLIRTYPKNIERRAKMKKYRAYLAEEQRITKAGASQVRSSTVRPIRDASRQAPTSGQPAPY